MNQILHILQKDLRRYAWAWITLLCCAAIEIYLHGTTAGLLESGLNEGLSMLTSMIGGILFFVVIVMVVQEETLADPDAYWLSRPIGRGKLLVSKLIFLLILIAAYQISETISLIMNGGGARAPFALLEMITALAIWQAQVFLSAQTRSLPRYLLLVVSIFVGFYVFMFGMMFLTSVFDGFDFDLDIGALPSTTPTHVLALIQTLLWLFVGMGMLTLIYCRRQTLLAWLVLLPASFVAGVLTPNDGSLGFASESYMSPNALELDHLRKGGTMHTNGNEFIEVRAVFSVSDEFANQDLWSTVHSPQIRIDGETIELKANPMSERLHEEANGLHSVKIGYAKRSDLAGDESNLAVEFSLNVTFSEQVPVDSIELKEGATYVGGGNRLIVRSIYRNDDDLDVRLAGILPSYSFEPEPATTHNEPFNGKFSFALEDQDGRHLRDFRQSNSWGGMGNVTKGNIEVFLNENASIEDYRITVFTRKITGTTYDYIRSSDVSFKK